jgi:hypothetical protein
MKSSILHHAEISIGATLGGRGSVSAQTVALPSGRYPKRAPAVPRLAQPPPCPAA